MPARTSFRWARWVADTTVFRLLEGAVDVVGAVVDSLDVEIDDDHSFGSDFDDAGDVLVGFGPRRG